MASRSLSERRQRAVDAREHFFFPEHFEQMIKTRSHSAASRREPYGVNDCAEFYAELCRGSFKCRFDFCGVEFLN